MARLRTEPAKAQQLMEEIAATRFEQGKWSDCIAALEDEAMTETSKRPDMVRLHARCLRPAPRGAALRGGTAAGRPA
jgi:hypothetical protein